MKRQIVFFTSILIFNFAFAVNNVHEAGLLLKRLVPDYYNKISFQLLTSKTGNDVFELESVNNKIVIRGNNANSMAVGLNFYLKYYCLTSVSWFVADPIQVPNVAPQVPRKINVEARTKNRFFLNYCTFGYTLTWWQWKDWERLIDWMALNGINMPLAISGQETVWYKVWKSFGLKDIEIRSYFTGPAHLPWHRMSNVDYWQSPLPNSWLTNQESLQKKIVARERSLNMRTVLPAFSGHVPKELKRIFPKSKIVQMTKWSGFEDQYRSHFLDPEDSIFSIIQSRFIKEQTKLYGTDHIYGLDPFNEVESPSWDTEYLAKASKTIYNSVKNVDTYATWLQMTWMFYYDSPKWTNPRIKAYLQGVPQDKLILLDYFCEKKEIWKQTDRYYGQPYIWCYLGNFGGNSFLAGNLKEVGRRIENTYINGGENFWGIGSTLEGFDMNPMMYEYVFEKAWLKNDDTDRWITDWANRRSGTPDRHVQKAWNILLEKVYVNHIQGWDGTLTNARPQLNEYRGVPKYKIWYRNSELFEAWEEMLQSKDTTRDSYLFDIVNIGRQVLGNYFADLHKNLTEAYRRKDLRGVIDNGKLMHEVLIDMDSLLSCHSTFLVGKWLNDSEKISKNKKEQHYYRNNARSIITTWGAKGQLLNDYANRAWSGLIDSYYTPRWDMFIGDLTTALNRGVLFDEKDYHNKVIQMEWDWANTDRKFIKTPRKDGFTIAKRLQLKYKDKIIN